MKYPLLPLCITLILIGCAEAPDPIAESSSASITTDARPNVIFILVDDMGFGDVGYNGSEIATPSLDQMALDGMKLDRNYVYPVCSPTRAALLTGQNPLHMGIEGPIDDYSSLPDGIKTMPQYFKDLGYQAHMVGKWHLGLSETEAWPMAKGFDSHYGFLGGWIDFYTHVFATRLDWQRNGVSVYEQGHATDLMTEEAIRIIESSDEDPFLLYLAYNSPHSPLQHPPSYSGLNDYPEITDRSVYAEMVTHMDLSVGRILDALSEQGILEDTIVIFSSDNGGALALGANNGNLRGGKRSSLEGGLRVPGLIQWAGHIDSSTILEQQISVHDWLPTLLDAVGGDASVIDNVYGHSMWPAIADQAQVDRNTIVMGGAGNLAVFDWPYKLVYIENPETGNFEPELFNLVEDPNEGNDLTAEFPEIVSRLIAEIEAMPEPEFSRLEPEYNNSPRYYTSEPTHDARLQATQEPWAEVVTNGTLPPYHE
jgi:arylsulfatase A-like enzyme